MSANGDVLRERFLATPLVTRHLMASTWIVCLLNPIFGVDDLLVASPYDIIRKGQLWRLVTFEAPANCSVSTFCLQGR